MSTYRGLTWDHDRGRKPLEAANRLMQERGHLFKIEWDFHSLEGFESAPIDRLFLEYDLIVLDHPHIGDAIETRMMKPIDEIFGLESLHELDKQFIGPSLASYQVDGKTLALPLDAATQVSVRRPDLVQHRLTTWNEVITLSEDASVALSLAGPHAFLSFLSAYVGLAGRTDFAQPAFVVDRAKAIQAIETLQVIYSNRKTDYLGLNPIGLLESMSTETRISYIPLVYGYVNYSRNDREYPLIFDDVPVFDGHNLHGSIIGGTGLGVSRHAKITEDLVTYLKWLISNETQSALIPENYGQPARADAWHDESVNRAARNFYRNTLRTMEGSSIRPRFPRYTEFQSHASRIVRDAVVLRTQPISTIDALESLAMAFADSMAPKYA